MAGARAGHGAHRGTGSVHPPLGQGSQGILEHRGSHRGRCAGDLPGRAGGVDRGSGKSPGGGGAPGAGGMTGSVDIAIVGGGMVGASLAVALEHLGVTTALVEAVPHNAATQPSFDERTTALSNGSRRILETLGVWPDVADAATRIAKIHV